MSEKDEKKINKIKSKISFRIPQTSQTIKSNIILGVGFILLVLGVVFCLKNYLREKDIKILGCVLNLAAGELLFFIAFGFFKLPSLVYLGTFFICNGWFVFFCESDMFVLGFKELWPVLICITGFSFIPYQIYKFKKFKAVYLFPAILFMCLGLVFFLFSLKIFPVTFVQFIKLWWPLIFVLVGISLIVTFIVLRNSSRAKAKLEQVQEYVDFEGESF